MEQKNRMSEELPIIALVIGSTLKDNAEIAIQTAENPEIRAMCRPVIVGNFDEVSRVASEIGVTSTLVHVELVIEDVSFDGNLIIVSRLKHPLSPKTADATARSGEHTIEDLDAALQLTMMGRADAMVIAPIDFEAVHKAGFFYKTINQLFDEWTRSASPITLEPSPDNPSINVVQGLPVNAIVMDSFSAASQDKTGLKLEIMKEAVLLAATVSKAAAKS